MKKYVSGKIAGLTEEEYRDAFGRGAALVMSMGDTPVNPLEVVACDDNSCSDSPLPRMENGELQHTWACYLKHDIIAMLDCEGIVMLPNWTTSRGGKFEKYVAEQCGLQVEFISHDYKELYDHGNK